MVTAAAIVGAAVVGAASARSSSKRAAATARKAGKGITGAAAQAQADVLENIPIAQEQLLGGARGAASIFQQAIPEQQRQLTAGSLAAQQTTGRGFRQAQQALLGLPVEEFSTAEVPFSDQPFQDAQTFLQPLGTPGSVTGPSTGQELISPQFQGQQLGVLTLRNMGLSDAQIRQQVRLGNVRGTNTSRTSSQQAPTGESIATGALSGLSGF